jgi:hypothetical protein
MRSLSVEFWVWIAPERPGYDDFVDEDEATLMYHPPASHKTTSEETVGARTRRHREATRHLEEASGEGTLLFSDGEGNFDITLERPDRTLTFRLHGADEAISSDENRDDNLVIAHGRTRLTAGVWHHVAAVYAQRQGCEWCGRVHLFLDGALDNVWSPVQKARPLRLAASDFKVLTGAPRLNLFPDAGTTTYDNTMNSDEHKNAEEQHHMEGARGVAMSDVRLWTRELGVNQVRRLMAEDIPFDVLDSHARFVHYHIRSTGSDVSDADSGDDAAHFDDDDDDESNDSNHDDDDDDDVSVEQLRLLHSADFAEFGRRADLVPMERRSSTLQAAPTKKSAKQKRKEEEEREEEHTSVSILIWAEDIPYQTSDVPSDLIECWRAVRRDGHKGI